MRKLYPVSVSCEVLEVSASGYFNWLRRRESGHGGPARRHSDEALLAHIRAIHAEVKGEYGWPRMHKELLARGIRVGKDRVRKLMQQHGIKARTKRKFVVTTDSRHSLPVAPDLVQRRFNPEAPNQLWSGDITYIPTDEGWLYLAAVIDLFNRQVVGWSLQPHRQASLEAQLAALQQSTAVGSNAPQLTLPLFRVALNPRFTRPFYAVPRTSAARTASG